MKIAFVGFGHVGRAFADLLEEKGTDLAGMGIRPLITGIYTLTQGGIIRAEGLSASRAAVLLRSGGSLRSLPHDLHLPSTFAFIRQCPADVLIEISPLDYRTGQPALRHLAEALRSGKHVVTANKGPIAFAYSRLRRSAQRHRRMLRFEGAVLDGLPVFNLVERTLPCTRILGFRGILNSTTNYLLTEMERGGSAAEALARAQALGVAERDPTADVQGWDAAAKVAALANVWLDAGITPLQVRRRGILRLTPRQVSQARSAGTPIRLVAGARRTGDRVDAYVRPERIPAHDLFANINGLSNILEIDTDTMNRVTVVEDNPGVRQTAYGLLSDLVSLRTAVLTGE